MSYDYYFVQQKKTCVELIQLFCFEMLLLLELFATDSSQVYFLSFSVLYFHLKYGHFHKKANLVPIKLSVQLSMGVGCTESSLI